MEEQQQNTLQHTETRLDAEYRAQEQQVNNARCHQVCAGRQANFRALNYQAGNFVNTDVGLLSVECQKCGVFKNFPKKLKDFVVQKAMLSWMHSHNHSHSCCICMRAPIVMADIFLSNI